MEVKRGFFHFILKMIDIILPYVSYGSQYEWYFFYFRIRRNKMVSRLSVKQSVFMSVFWLRQLFRYFVNVNWDRFLWCGDPLRILLYFLQANMNHLNFASWEIKFGYNLHSMEVNWGYVCFLLKAMLCCFSFLVEELSCWLLLMFFFCY